MSFPVDLQEKIIVALRTVQDPEIPVNVYDLGLIYTIDINPEFELNVQMTLTSPACPVAELIPEQVAQAIRTIPEIKLVKVQVVWEPQWTMEMMSEAARLQLNLF